MNIDEFLDSNKAIDNIGETDIIKIKYNENIDFIYKPEYRKFEYGRELQFLGLFEKITKKLYGSSLDFQSNYEKELYSNYFAGSISSIGKNLIDGADIYLKAYIEENKLQLINNSKKIFDKYLADESNKRKVKEDSIHNYIYQEDNSEINFSVKDDYYYEENIKDLIIQYIQSPVETSKNVFKKYIDSQEKEKSLYINNAYEKVTVKEYIGVMLQICQYKNMLLQELIDNPNNEYKKKHNIIGSIKDLDAQMVTITLKHDDEMITLKYPRNILEQMDLYEWHIPDLKVRDKVEKLYKNIYGQEKDDTFIKEIAKIEYKKRTIYEDTKLLDLENNLSNNIEETHDIVEDMFD